MVQVGPRIGTRREAAVDRDESQTPPTTAGRRKRFSVEIPIDPEYLPFLGLLLLALVLRFFQLGDKALHHDESLHAFYSWRLYDGQGYVHDPMMHGPLLFIGSALAFLVFGASDFTSRLVPALLGTALVGMPFFLRQEIGRRGALAAGVLLAVSPSFLYFSRFIRHDIYVDVFTLMMVIGVFRYLASGLHRWFYITVIGAALLFATKEDFYISGFVLFLFFAAAWFLLRGDRRLLFRARIRALGWRPWAVGTGLFLAINVLLYTTFLTNPRGICTALITLPIGGCSGSVGALSYWLNQHDVARGGQPWFYYLMLVPLYEFLPLIIGGVAVFRLKSRGLFGWFLIYWFVLGLAIYSWAGEKMPWMLPQIALPLILLAARQLGDWSEMGWGHLALSARGWATAGITLLGVLGLAMYVGLGAAAAASPLDQQAVALQKIGLAALVAACVAGLVYLWPRWTSRVIVPGIALGALAILGTAYVRTSFGLSYDHPDNPVEPLIYVQSTHDVVWVAQEIDRVAQQTGKGKSLPILLDNGWADGDHESVAWPFEWYLRDYKNRRYYTKTIDPSLNLAEYPILLARTPNIDPIAEALTQYRGTTLALNAWFPEDYKNFAGTLGPVIPIGSIKFQVPWIRFDLLAQTLSKPQNDLSLLRFLVYREPPSPLGRREMSFYERTDLPQNGPAPLGAAAPAQAAANAPTQQRQATLQKASDGADLYGLASDGRSILQDPKGAALGKDGRLYVVEAGANRVTMFNPDGTVSGSFGGAGQTDGKFKEPWGIAVAPNGNVYVADTWNHRIQYFAPDGRFLGQWGKLGDAKGQANADPMMLWGPRGLAFSSGGDLYVTDTGNKRVLVYSPDGTFLRAFGGLGTDAGQFNEPVGIAFDSAGNVLWVADTWNGRVQQFDPSGKPLAQFPLPAGFENHSVSNKLFLALDQQSRIVVSYPDSGRIYTFDRAGATVKETDLPKRGAPTGIMVGSDGKLFVADARNGQVAVYPAS